MFRVRLPVELTRLRLRDLGGFRSGFAYLFRGGRLLLDTRSVWSLLIAPVLLNAILFVLFLLAAGTMLRGSLSAFQAEAWWQAAVVALLVVAFAGAVMFIGTSLVVFLGSVLSAPFYDRIAQVITRKLGGIVTDHAWWAHVGPSVRHAATLLWWYLLVQAGLIILYVVPGVFGPVAFVSVGFLATAFFLALVFLDFSFEFHGWSFVERRRWCWDNKGIVLGFGTAVFLGMGIPGLNVFVPPMAIVGSVLLFRDNYVSTGSNRPR